MKLRFLLISLIGLILLSACVQKNIEKSEEKWKSDVIPGKGAGVDPTGKGEDGPWNHRLLIATSPDGVTWHKTYKILADQASVPDVIVDNQGFVRVYYVDFYNLGITVAISKDLKEWTYIKVKGLGPEWVDPSVVILPDGRFRLYASYMPLKGKQNKIVSAISDDGISFKKEGTVYQSENMLTDPEVIYANGKWVMLVDEHDEKRGITKTVMLVSKSGTEFKKVREFRFPGSVPCLIKYKNGYMLYIHKFDFSSIIGYYSEDMKKWVNETIALEGGGKGSLDEHGVADPAVARLKDGRYIMVYKTWIEKPDFMKNAEKQKMPPLPPEVSGENKSMFKIEAFAFRFGSWGHKHDEYAYTPGYKWMKPHPGPFNRYYIEKERGVYDFSACDAGVKKAQEFNAEIVATIWPYAEWDEECHRGREGFGKATGGGPFAYVLPSSRFKPCDMQAYKNFVRALVERYDGDGFNDMPGLKKPIKYWEVLNEPEAQTKDYRVFFQGSGKEYFELVKATYEAVKEADSEAKVVIGGAGTLDEASIRWWEEFYGAGGGRYFDIAAVHSYGGEDYDFNTERLKELLEKHDIKKPVWITEAGPLPFMGREEEIMFVKSAIRAFANGAEVLFFDYEPIAPVMAYIIGDFEKVEKLSGGAYVFEAGGDKVYVVWEKVKIPVEGEVYAVDIYGNAKREDASKIEINEPLYLFKSEKILQRLDTLTKAIKEATSEAAPEIKKEGEFVDLRKSIVDVEEVAKQCYHLTYPDFDMYVFKGKCDAARGRYEYKIGDVTFVFDDEGVFHVLKNQEQKEIEKLMNSLKMIGNSIILLVSDDGINWKETGITVAKGGSVPDLVVGYDERLYMYYAASPYTRIKLKVSEDGINWREKETNLPPGWVDPEVVLVDGKYRLYTNVGVIAESGDGSNFQEVATSVKVMDPAVFITNGKWYMIGWDGGYYNYLFSSEDGIKFSKIKNLDLNGANVCDAMRKEGYVYLYCTGKSGIVLFKSKDGVSWKEEGIVYKSDKMIADPAVAFFNGKYYMAVAVYE